MKKLSWIVALLLLSISCLLMAADKKNDKPQTFTGVVGDKMCGAKHMMEGSAAECTRACVKSGSDFALISGNKVYTLKGDAAAIDKFAGEEATVTGTLNADIIQVTAIAAAQ